MHSTFKPSLSRRNKINILVHFSSKDPFNFKPHLNKRQLSTNFHLSISLFLLITYCNTTCTLTRSHLRDVFAVIIRQTLKTAMASDTIPHFVIRLGNITQTFAVGKLKSLNWKSNGAWVQQQNLGVCCSTWNRPCLNWAVWFLSVCYGAIWNWI